MIASLTKVLLLNGIEGGGSPTVNPPAVTTIRVSPSGPVMMVSILSSRPEIKNKRKTKHYCSFSFIFPTLGGPYWKLLVPPQKNRGVDLILMPRHWRRGPPLLGPYIFLCVTNHFMALTEISCSEIFFFFKQVGNGFYRRGMSAPCLIEMASWK